MFQHFAKVIDKYLKFAILLFVIIMAGCSQQSTSPLSVGFHNVNAKFNAYLQAEEKIQEAESTLFENHKDNFDEPLPIFIPLDSNAASSVSEQLEAVIKKTSLIADRHQNSKWLDDSYNLIGKARMYKGDFTNAIETFKYVNTFSNNESAKHEALISLMRVYIEQKEYGTALRVAEFLRSENLNKENLKNFYLTKAYLHQQNSEPEISLGILELTLPMLNKNIQKARLEYATGQMYASIGQNEKASQHFLQVKKNKASYELDFYATLNNASVNNNHEIFEKLLKDPKNKDLNDRILQAMANGDLLSNKNDDAKEKLKASIKNSSNADIQAQSYLKLADLYFDKDKNYLLAAKYYDSTLSKLNTSSKNYKKVVDKVVYLEKYVKYTNTIATEDSLQTLAKLSDEDLDKAFKRITLNKEAEEQAILLKQEEIKRISTQQNVSASLNTNTTKSNFYFDNPVAVAQGKNTFIQKYGRRTLEDNWRRSEKNSNNLSFGNPKNREKREKSEEELISEDLAKNAASKLEFTNKLPKSKEALTLSKKMQEDALFEIGKIYQFSFKEAKEAEKTYNEVLNKYPQTDHEAEIYYLQVLLNKENEEKRKANEKKLFEKFPDSYFTRLLTRESGTLSAGAESNIQKIYAEAYSQFKTNSFSQSKELLKKALSDYPNSQIEDKCEFLLTLISSKTDSLAEYKKKLIKFVVNFPKSNLNKMATEYLDVLNNNERDKNAENAAKNRDTDPPVENNNNEKEKKEEKEEKN